jgi:hypothetical protein
VGGGIYSYNDAARPVASLEDQLFRRDMKLPIITEAQRKVGFAELGQLLYCPGKIRLRRPMGL